MEVWCTCRVMLLGVITSLSYLKPHVFVLFASSLCLVACVDLLLPVVLEMMVVACGLGWARPRSSKG